MGETRRLIKNTGIIAVGGMATKLVSFLLLPLYTSVLSTGDYGTVDYINTIALFCVPAVSLLMGIIGFCHVPCPPVFYRMSG